MELDLPFIWAGLIAFGAVLVSLYSGMLTWAVIATLTVLTVLLTFLLPRVQRPGEARGHGPVGNIVVPSIVVGVVRDRLSGIGGRRDAEARPSGACGLALP